jgi:hypothetical protein
MWPSVRASNQIAFPRALAPFGWVTLVKVQCQPFASIITALVATGMGVCEMKKRGSARCELVERMAALIASFERAQREPDRWESFCAMLAMDNIAFGDLGAANQQIAFVQLPQELRPPSLFSYIPRSYRAMTVAELREILHDVEDPASSPGLG